MGLILGVNEASSLPNLASALQKKTVSFWEDLNELDEQYYYPAMCLGTVQDIVCPQEIKNSKPTREGYVVVQPEYLKGMSDLFHDNRKYFFDDLIGTDEDWEIFVDISRSDRSYLENLNRSISAIKKSSPFFASIFDSLVTEIIPLKQQRARGLSLDILRGSLFLGAPDDYPEILLMMDIVHEVGHQAITVLNSADALFECSYSTPVYSEIRHTERPAMQSLHAAAAIAYMLKLVSDMGCKDQKHPDCPDYLAPTLKKAVSNLRERCDFSPVGNIILDDFDTLATANL